MTGFGLAAATGMKEVTSDQATQWDFGNFFVPFGIPKIIVVNADELFWNVQEDFPRDLTNPST